MRPKPRHHQPPPPPDHNRDSLSYRNHPPATPQFNPTTTTTRDSDVSFCSSRPSHSSKPPSTTDKQSMLRSINAFLSSHNLPISLSFKPLPSAKDVSDTLRFLLSCLEFPLPNPPTTTNKSTTATTLDDELFHVLKLLNCPHKITKSALRAPAAPHAFPQVLAVIHWLVQLADYNNYLNSDDSTSSPTSYSDRFSYMKDNVMAYAVNSYVPYMRGDDEEVELLDKEFSDKLENEKELMVNKLTSLDEEVKKLELEKEELKSKPSELEMHESRRKDLEGDCAKFQEYINQLQSSNSITEKALEEKEKELAAKAEHVKRIREENEELKKRVDAQGFNMRDVERMKRELTAVEKEISEAEASRSSWEERISEVDEAIRHKRNELEALFFECNQALRRLKLGVDFQYVFNANGSTPAEVLGVNYKSILKPALSAFAEENKKCTTAKWEELIALQQQSKELSTRIEAKKKRLAELQLHIDDAERQFEVIRNQIEEYTSWCTSEAQRIRGEVEAETHNFDMTEREATEALEAAKLRLHELTKQSKQETKDCEYELLALINSVSSCKEYTEKKLSDMRKDVSETAEFMANAYKNTLPQQSNIAVVPKFLTTSII